MESQRYANRCYRIHRAERLSGECICVTAVVPAAVTSAETFNAQTVKEGGRSCRSHRWKDTPDCPRRCWWFCECLRRTMILIASPQTWHAARNRCITALRREIQIVLYVHSTTSGEMRYYMALSKHLDLDTTQSNTDFEAETIIKTST